MTPAPEQEARRVIDQLLHAAGWLVQDCAAANIRAGRGVALREFSLATGYGFADYLLYIDGKAAGVIEAKKAGVTLTGVEIQAERYTKGLPAGLPAWRKPLPFSYQSTGVETRFTSGLDPEPRSRNVFAFHRPETLAGWLESSLISSKYDGSPFSSSGASVAAEKQAQTFLARLQSMPALRTDGLWPAQINAIRNLETSLRANRPRALIQMATGSGKTFTAINFIYRLIKFAGARRVLFLVDRGNLGRQTLKEFQQYTSPYNNFTFTEEYIVQHLASNRLDKSARVCICTIQRLYSMLRGRELPEEIDEESPAELAGPPEPIEYNPDFPIEEFDIIVTDECHRSIYDLWRQVLEYFDAHLIGLTATPNKQTFGFFDQNLVMEYGHEQAVADGVNVNYDVYRIRTRISEQGSAVEAGYYVDTRDRETRAVRWHRLDEAFAYEANQLDRDVVAIDQIRKVIRTFRDRLFTEIFPGRTEVPKTLIFAKNDSHAEDIVQIVREEFGKGNEFAQKITYRTGFQRVTTAVVLPDGTERQDVTWERVANLTPDQILQNLRNSYFPRIAVTVDMVATGTDVKPLEIVLFMRSVKSRSFFEQMKGRGVRIINDNDLQAVTPDALSKDRFVIVDAVGICEKDLTDSRPMDRKKSVALKDLLKVVSYGNTDPDVISTVAVRLSRLKKKLTAGEQEQVKKLSGGKLLKEVVGEMVSALQPDRHLEEARRAFAVDEPTAAQTGEVAAKMITAAVKPLQESGELRRLLAEIQSIAEQTIDKVSTDTVLFAGFTEDKAKSVVDSFERFIAENKDEITALQVLYSRPYKQRLRFDDVRELAEKLVAQVEHLRAYQAHPQGWEKRVPDELWQAYRKLEASKVRGAAANHILTDLVSLVRFAMHQENELVPYPEKVRVNFEAWMGQQEQGGRTFTAEQRRWLEMMRDHIAANLQIESEDFEYAPFAQAGGIGKVWQVFGDELSMILDELNEALVA